MGALHNLGASPKTKGWLWQHYRRGGVRGAYGDAYFMDGKGDTGSSHEVEVVSDAKANPNSRFSASVNLGSSRYYQQSINQFNVSFWMF